MCQLFTSGGQSIGTSASVLPGNIQGWFPLGLIHLISLQSKGLSRVFNTTIWKHPFFRVQPSLWSNSYIHTWLWEKTIALTYGPMFVGKVMSLLFNMLCRIVIAFFPKEQVSFNFMAVVTVCSDFGAQEHKMCHCFKFLSFNLHEAMGPNAIILVFWMLSFKPAFSLSSFTLKRLCSSSSLSAIRLASSEYLRLLMLLWEVLIPPCESSSPALHMIYSEYKLNKQGDNIQPYHTSFPIWRQPVVPCQFQTVASWPAFRFFRRQVSWSGTPISLRIFHSLLWST